MLVYSILRFGVKSPNSIKSSNILDRGFSLHAHSNNKYYRIQVLINEQLKKLKLIEY